MANPKSPDRFTRIATIVREFAGATPGTYPFELARARLAKLGVSDKLIDSEEAVRASMTFIRLTEPERPSLRWCCDVPATTWTEHEHGYHPGCTSVGNTRLRMEMEAALRRQASSA